MKRSVKVTITLATVILVAAMIFIFSSQSGQDSSKLSGTITEWVLSRLIPGFSEMTHKQRLPYLKQWGLIIRKAAHFSEFALLAITLTFYLRYRLEGRRPQFIALCAWIAATLYACTDELHQMFVDSRGPAVTDVMIDSVGALTGAIIGTAVMALWLRHKYRAVDHQGPRMNA